MKDSEEDLGLRSGYPGALPATWRIEKEPQRRPFWFLTSSTRLGVVSGSVDDMASPQETDLCYAWEKYMDCRLQGADLQVWRFWQECNVRDHSLGGGAAYFLQEQVLKKRWCHCTWEKVWRQPCILFILIETNYLFSITIQLQNRFSPGFHSKGWVDTKLVCFLRLNSKSLFCDRCYMNAFNLDKLMNKVILSRNTLLLIFALAVPRSVFTNTFRQNAPVWILCRIIHVHMKSG